ncbi:hypothetical protein [Cupriavidus numazuensis]|uniref:hypothetical protein n=1 Tax=Cupriavidus numazuensis TaxID=221992 RepID=UPI001BAB135B|nr:hypothetical protein [Cupriavidus numazuensis]
MDSSLFYKVLQSHFRELPGRITEATPSAFNSVFDSTEAGKQGNIVYLYRTERAFPRISGKTDILYIGQTKQTFRARYARYAELLATSPTNGPKYKAIIAGHGPIRIEICHFGVFGSTLKDAEAQLLWWYFQCHCEFPPVNRSGARSRTGECTGTLVLDDYMKEMPIV